MSDDSTLFDLWQRGDAAAKGKLIERIYQRLRGLARKILHQDFPVLHNLHQTTSVANRVVERLLKFLDKVEGFRPASAADFFAFAALQMRWVLIDLARKARRRPTAGDPEHEAADDTLDPSKLAMCREFHEGVDQLPQELRQVFDLCFYHGQTQAEAAAELGIHPKEASRRWIRAIRKLAKRLGLESTLQPRGRARKKEGKRSE